MTFTELAADWLSLRQNCTESSRKAYAYHAAELGRFFGDLAEPSLRDACRRWQTERRAALAPRSFNAELQVLRRILDHGIAEGALATNPAGRLSRQRVLEPLDQVPTAAERDAILAELRKTGPSKTADLIEFLSLTGLRRAEAERLTWDDCDLAKGVLLVGRRGETKNGKGRRVPILPKCAELLKRLWTDNGEMLVFGALDIRYQLHAACDALGLPHYRSYHVWRKFFASEAMAAGASVQGLADILGHSDRGALLLRIYAHLRPDVLKDDVTKLTARFGASTGDATKKEQDSEENV
jgi:integrase